MATPALLRFQCRLKHAWCLIMGNWLAMLLIATPLMNYESLMEKLPATVVTGFKCLVVVHLVSFLIQSINSCCLPSSSYKGTPTTCYYLKIFLWGLRNPLSLIYRKQALFNFPSFHALFHMYLDACRAIFPPAIQLLYDF